MKSDEQYLEPFKWDFRFLSLAKLVSSWSKDPSTQCGAVLVRDNKTIASTGYNGFPSRIADDPELLSTRIAKLPRVIHAEMNALLYHREAFPLDRHCLYVYPALPCVRCAVHIIQAGVRRIVAPYGPMKHWEESMAMSRALFTEANVEVKEYAMDPELGTWTGVAIRESHDGAASQRLGSKPDEAGEDFKFL